MREDLTLGRALAHVALAVAFVLAVAGCSGPPRAAQTALSVTAESVAGADVLVAPRAAQAAQAARAAAREVEGFEAALAAYDAAMAPWVAVERALLEAKGALLALQAAYDAWEAGAEDGPERWRAAVACGFPILARVGEALLRAGVELPPKLTRAMTLLLAFAEGQCPATSPEVTP